MATRSKRFGDGFLVSLTRRDSLALFSQAYIDTVGIADTYQQRLEGLFPTVSFVVTSKADAIYPIVSAASIVAKVTRDRLLAAWNFLEKDVDKGDESRVFGSGYPSGEFSAMRFGVQQSRADHWSLGVRNRSQDRRMAGEQPRTRLWLPQRCSLQLAARQNGADEEGSQSQVVRRSSPAASELC